MQTTRNNMQALIHFYDQNQNQKQSHNTPLNDNLNRSTPKHYSFCSSPLSSQSPATLTPDSTSNANTSEVCYQVDLDQWLNLGQPRRPNPVSSNLPQLPSQPPIQKHLRHQSMPSYPPPVPPRRSRNGSCEIPVETNETRAERDRASDNSAPHIPRLVRREEVRKPGVDLTHFRKAIQALWFTLLDLNCKLNVRKQRAHSIHHSGHHFYDQLDRKILLPGSIIRLVWVRSGLTLSTLSQIWDSIDQSKTGRMNFEEFLLGMYQISKLRQEKRFSEEEVEEERRSDLSVEETGRQRRNSEKGQYKSVEMSRKVSTIRLEMSREVSTIRRRRTPPLVPSSRSGSVSSSSDSSSSHHHHPRINNTSLLHPLVSKHESHPFFHVDPNPNIPLLPASPPLITSLSFHPPLLI